MGAEKTRKERVQHTHSKLISFGASRKHTQGGGRSRAFLAAGAGAACSSSPSLSSPLSSSLVLLSSSLSDAAAARRRATGRFPFAAAALRATENNTTHVSVLLPSRRSHHLNTAQTRAEHSLKL